MNSYPSIYTIGHRYIAELFNVPVNVEEKVDGSQFSFKKLSNGDLEVRSKGADILLDAPPQMFKRAVETVKSLAPDLATGVTYRGEVLDRPKHNTLVYNRVPAGNIILFDVELGDSSYLQYEHKEEEAERLGLEVVPLLYTGYINGVGELRAFLDRESCLGGPKIEGVVVKPRYGNLYDSHGKLLIGKFVSEEFKEVHQRTWKKDNPTQKAIIDRIAEDLKTPARYQKAVQHLAEQDLLTQTPKDIGALVKEVPADIEKEMKEEIMERLYKHAWPYIRRKVVQGLPEWYKDQLLQKQFQTIE